MFPDEPIEHFVTLFDSNFLPIGMSLHHSMMQNAQPFHLCILCMDELVERQLREINLLHVSLIPLHEVETDALLGVKNGRTRGEYCWTLTPFTSQFVFDRNKNVERVTYLDADLFFFDNPKILLDEFDISGKDVLITEHAYAPDCDYSEKAGKFCVQFITFRRTQGGIKVMSWWQERCLEWCFYRYEDGKIGDQKYLDDWPERFADEVHVLVQKERTLGPWNADYYFEQANVCVPVFFHFEGFRVLTENKMRWYKGFRLRSQAVMDYYMLYTLEVLNSLQFIQSIWNTVPTLNDEKTFKRRAAKYYHLLRGRSRYFKYFLDR